MSKRNGGQVRDVTICTLWEGDYHKGLAVLVNSLIEAGYTGIVWAGYRGALPPWASGDRDWRGNVHFLVTAGVTVVFVQVKTDAHLSHYKPVWFRYVLEVLAPTSEGLFYLDPDILVLCPWSTFEKWLDCGIAVCEDIHTPLNPTHPLVHRWRQFLDTIGLAFLQPVDAYINGGLIGLPRKALPLLDKWLLIWAAAQEAFALGPVLKIDRRSHLFHNTDQDALTIALYASPFTLSRVGVDGMGFSRGEWLTFHAIGVKPWRRRVLSDLLRGNVPDRAMRLYWFYAGGPVQVETTIQINLHRHLLPIASFVGRFYGRRG